MTSQNPPAPKKSEGLGGAIVIAIFFVVIAIWWMIPGGDTPSAPAVPSIHTGDTVRVNTTSTVAVDDPSWDAMTEALHAKDNVGLAQLSLAGKIFIVNVGDSALVLDTGITSIKIRATSGKANGRAGWIIREFVSK